MSLDAASPSFVFDEEKLSEDVYDIHHQEACIDEVETATSADLYDVVVNDPYALEGAAVNDSILGNEEEKISKPILNIAVTTEKVRRDREPEWSLYDESNYGFQTDPSLNGKWGSGDRNAHLIKRFERYQREGIRRSVGAILICHRKGFPHVLLLQNSKESKHNIMIFRYKSWDKPREILQSKLDRCIIQYNTGVNKQWTSLSQQSMNSEGGNAEVGEYLGEWWRNEFDEDLLPYVSPHVTRPKERIRIYQVQLPPKCTFRLPSQTKLTALPLFDLNQMTCGGALSGVPHILSRFKLRILIATSDKDVAAAARADAAAALDTDLLNDDDANALDEVLYDSSIMNGVEGGVNKASDASTLEELPPELADLAAEEE